MTKKQESKAGLNIYDSHRFKYGLGIFICLALLFTTAVFLVLQGTQARQFSDGRDTLCDVTLSKNTSCGHKYPCLAVHYQARKNESKPNSSTPTTLGVAHFRPNSTVARRLWRCRRKPSCTQRISCRISTAGNVKHGWSYPLGWIILLSCAAAFLIISILYLIIRCRSYVPFPLPESNGTVSAFVDADKSRPSSEHEIIDKPNAGCR